MRASRLPLVLAFCYLTPLVGQAQVRRSDLAQLLGFETQRGPGAPRDWGGGPIETLVADDKIVHSGKWAARLERQADSANFFSTITLGIPIDFTGTTVELRGFLKTEDVSVSAGLWLREDVERTSVAFDNMESRQLNGTHDWAEYSIVLPLRPAATSLVFGVRSTGTGTTWADDLQLLVDGKPIWDAPKRQEPVTPLDQDHAFNGGSGISTGELSKTQIDNLVTLGKVWGFLKYHHPAIVSGKRHWTTICSACCPRCLPPTIVRRPTPLCTNGSNPLIPLRTARNAPASKNRTCT